MRQAIARQASAPVAVVRRDMPVAIGWPPAPVAATGAARDSWSGLSRDLIERFIEVALQERSLSRSARRAYRGDLVAFDKWMQLARARTLVGARSTDLRNFLDSRRLAGIESRLLRRMVASLEDFFHYVHSTGCRSDNPAQRLRRVGVARRDDMRRPVAGGTR